MLNVFSDNGTKISDQIRRLQQCAGSSYIRLLFAGPKDEPLDMLKPSVIDILVWVNKKILFELPQIKEYPTFIHGIDVRIRIATNMLNKEVNSGTLTKEMAMTYHERMTSRIREILSKIYVEDLPF